MTGFGPGGCTNKIHSGPVKLGAQTHLNESSKVFDMHVALLVGLKIE